MMTHSDVFLDDLLRTRRKFAAAIVANASDLWHCDGHIVPRCRSSDKTMRLEIEIAFPEGRCRFLSHNPGG
jgi:hypothetical protein